MNVGRLKRKDLKVWLPLGDIEGVKILCRHVSQSQFDTILEETTDDKGVKDDKAFNCALAAAVVEAWEGIDEDGTEFPCNKENINYLMEECTPFRLLVRDTPLSMGKMLAAEKAATEKK